MTDQIIVPPSVDKSRLNDVFDRMAKNWKSELVGRQKIADFTGGLFTPKTMANLDSIGDGPPRIKFGRNVGYPKRELIEWMKRRTTSHTEKHETK
jgi:hypothetical protein